MKLLSMVKLVVAAGALCSASAFAAGIFSEASSSAPCQSYTGTGKIYYDNAEHSYTVTLKVRKLGNGRDLLDYSYVFVGDKVSRTPIIIDSGRGRHDKVLVPKSKDALDDYDAYVETGWAHELEYEEIHQNEGTPKKRTILLSYNDVRGARTTHHVLAYRIDGKWQLTSTGAFGIAMDGEPNIWTHKLSQTDTCSL